MEDSESCSCSATIEATIEIDEDVAQSLNAEEVGTRKRGPWIRPPLRIESLRVRCPDSIRIRDLNEEALTLLTSHLSLPSYGSLRNWDSVGIHLGISDYEIMSFQHDPRPMEAVLKKCWDHPANNLISALHFCKRTDLLYSLRKLSRTGRLKKPLEHVLLVHYEITPEETRNFKWLRKNLRQYASQRQFAIIDIAELDIDPNITSAVEDAFVKANQIVVTFTPSHIEAVKSRSTQCRTVVYMHDLMNQEFFTMNSNNKRFRAVIFDDTQLGDLPIGWPRSTLVYHFPTNMSALCTKIFKSDNVENTDTL